MKYSKALTQNMKSQSSVQHYRWEDRDQTYYRGTCVDSCFIQNFKSVVCLYLINKSRVSFLLAIKSFFKFFTYSTKEFYFIEKMCKILRRFLEKYTRTTVFFVEYVYYEGNSISYLVNFEVYLRVMCRCDRQSVQNFRLMRRLQNLNELSNFD